MQLWEVFLTELDVLAYGARQHLNQPTRPLCVLTSSAGFWLMMEDIPFENYRCCFFFPVPFVRSLPLPLSLPILCLCLVRSPALISLLLSGKSPSHCCKGSSASSDPNHACSSSFHLVFKQLCRLHLPPFLFIHKLAKTLRAALESVLLISQRRQT